jgi:hypothetical protein
MDVWPSMISQYSTPITESQINPALLDQSGVENA